MEAIADYFFRDIGLMFGRAIRQVLRRMDTLHTVTMLSVAGMVLFLYVFVGAVLLLEEILILFTGKKEL